MATSQMLPKGQIVLADYRKHNYGRLDRLIDSIKNDGLVHPLILAPNRTLLHGERRLAALDKLGKSEIPVVYVSDMGEFTDMLRVQYQDRTGSLSLRPSEMAAFLDAAIISGLAVPTSEIGREVSVLSLLANALLGGVKTISVLLTIHRTAYKGLDEDDRRLGREVLDDLDNGIGIHTSWHKFSAVIGTKYDIRITHKYIDSLKKDVGKNLSGKGKVSAGNQRHTLVQAANALDAVKSALSTIGKLHDDIGTDERAEYATRLRGARIAISSAITMLEGKNK